MDLGPKDHDILNLQCILGKRFNSQILKYFSIFSLEKIFDISCKIICMKFQILYSGKNKNNINNLLSAELAQSMLLTLKAPFKSVADDNYL